MYINHQPLFPAIINKDLLYNKSAGSLWVSSERQDILNNSTRGESTRMHCTAMYVYVCELTLNIYCFQVPVVSKYTETARQILKIFYQVY